MMDKSGSGNGRQMKVLIVDDEPFMLQAWKKILDGHECEINTLLNGTEVVPVVENWGPDVTVLDIHMPNVSGLDLLKEINSKNW